MVVIRVVVKVILVDDIVVAGVIVLADVRVVAKVIVLVDVWVLAKVIFFYWLGFYLALLFW